MGHSLNLNHPFESIAGFQNVVSVMQWFYPNYVGVNEYNCIPYVSLHVTNFDRVALRAVWDLYNS